MNGIFQPGGSLQLDVKSYVERSCDIELFEHILAGNYCFILTARQMGKSSLKIRTVDKLRKIGYYCATIDTTQIVGRYSNNDTVYYTFLKQILKQLNITFDLSNWWKINELVTPSARFTEFILEELLPIIPGKLIIFLDEIDALLSIDKEYFSANEFFAVIRSHFNQRGENEIMNRLIYVIIGVATPDELMSDSLLTPFNIGVSIKLSFFTYEESRPLMYGFEDLQADKEKLLKEVLYWTNGQPYLTQYLCDIIVRENSFVNDIPNLVKNYVDRYFIHPKDKDLNINVSNIQKRIREHPTHAPKMLGTYQDVLTTQNVRISGSRTHIYLILSGIVREKDGFLVSSNNIYQTRFDISWVADSLSSLNRPFSNDYLKWLQNGKKIAQIRLPSSKIEKYLDWEKGRNDLSNTEREFIQEVQIKKDRNRKRHFVVIGIVFVLVSLTLMGLLYLNYLFQTKMHKISDLYNNVNQQSDTLLKQNLLAIIKDLDKNEILKVLKTSLLEEKSLGTKLFLSQKDIENLNTVLKYKNAAQTEEIKNPTLAMYLANIALGLDASTNKYSLIYKIYADNLLYKTIVQNEKLEMKLCDVSEDNQMFILGISPNTIELFSQNGTKLQVFDDAQNNLTSIDISPNNKLVGAITSIGNIYIWDIEGKLIKTLNTNGKGLLKFIFSPNSKGFFVTNGNDINVYDLSGELINSFIGHTAVINSLAVSKNGQYLLSGSNDRTAILWEMDGKKADVFKSESINEILYVAISPSNNYILTASSNHKITIWEKLGIDITKVENQTQNIVCGDFSIDETRFVLGGNDGSVKIWSLNGKLLEELNGHNSTVFGLKFTNEGNELLTFSNDNKVNKWNLYGHKILDINHHSTSISSISISNSSKYIVSGASDGVARLTNIETNHSINLREHSEKINHICFSPDDKWILTCSSDKEACLWVDGDLNVKLKSHTAGVMLGVFSPQSNKVYTFTYDKKMYIWKINGTLISNNIIFESLPSSVAVDNITGNIAIGTSDGHICIYNSHGKFVTKFKITNMSVHEIVFSNNDNTLWVVSGKRFLSNYSFNGENLKNIPINANMISISPNALFYALADYTNGIEILEINEQVFQRFSPLSSSITALKISKNSKLIVIGFENGNIQVLTVKPLLNEYIKQNFPDKYLENTLRKYEYR